MKKLLKTLVVLLTTIVSLTNCRSSDKFIERGYSYNLIDEPATVHKVWMPTYVRYHKKHKRFSFINGHYRIVLGEQAWTYRKVRLRNRYGRI